MWTMWTKMGGGQTKAIINKWCPRGKIMGSQWMVQVKAVKLWPDADLAFINSLRVEDLSNIV